MLVPVLDWKALRKKRGLRRALIGSATILCLCGAGLAAYHFWPEPAPKPPPPMATSSLEEDADYAASNDFNRLTMRQRQDWLDGHVRKTNAMDDDVFLAKIRQMDLDKRNRLRENLTGVMRERILNHVKTYRKLPESEKKEFLDKNIDEMEQLNRKFLRVLGKPVPPRRGWGLRQGSASAQPMTNEDREFHREERMASHDEFRKQMKHFMVDTPPDLRAATVDYFSDVFTRQVQRVLQDALGLRRK
ncbi:MAG: hypothetical protein JXQ73_21360 [Phycisphaerae bacterium]|nr:hypothetical protein [Phycisphaerae bacterium]